MNFISIIPAQLIETTITNALLNAIINPSRKGPIDPTPFQLYQMQHQQQMNECNNFTPPTPPAPAQGQHLPTNICPPVPHLHNNNLRY